MEITEIEERKNKQIAELIKNHENAFSEIKNYYSDITLNNLALISSLKVCASTDIECITCMLSIPSPYYAGT
jgi:hypothetical protein